MPFYHIEVYGCQMNVRDGESLEGILVSAGYRKAPGPDKADVVLVVTCAVRERAEVRALGRVTQLAGVRRRRKPVVVICGCVAQEHGGSLLERFPQVDLVVGPDEYQGLPGLLESGVRAFATGLGSGCDEGVRPVRSMFPRAFVTVARGCDNFCSYCIVPYVRGRERSRKPRDILAEVEELASSGFREITLLGQNVNSYRDGGTGFPELLSMVARAVPECWIRFVTSHPRDFGPELTEAMAGRPNICPALHLPAQSGSDRILERMNRGYARAEYLAKTAMVRERIPGIVLSTDMIAGFPGETDSDFHDSLSLLSEVRFDYGFLFRYSERSGTAAAGMPGSVPVPERLSRLHAMQELQNRITREKSSLLRGKTLPVLITGPGSLEGQLTGRTPGNRTVVVTGADAPPGTFMNVLISRADGWTHFGEKA